MRSRGQLFFSSDLPPAQWRTDKNHYARHNSYIELLALEQLSSKIELKAVCRGGDRIESNPKEISELELAAGQILSAGK